MNRLPTALAIALSVLFASAAHAQIGIYGQFNGTHDPGVGGWYTGLTFGAYDDVLHSGPLHAGFDLRAGFAGGHQYSYHDFLFGPRLAVFVNELRRLLEQHSASGRFWDWPGDTEVIIATRR